MNLFFTSLTSWYQQIFDVLDSAKIFQTVSLLDILIGAVAISIVASAFWRGEKG